MKTPIKDLREDQLNSWWEGDSGCDIMVPFGTGVRSVGNGTILYSEEGHTPWGTVNNVGIDTPGSILLLLDQPIVMNGVPYPLVWYTHLSYLVKQVKDDGGVKPQTYEGEWIGNTGKGNEKNHLHFGVLIRRAQEDGDFMMPEDVAGMLKMWVTRGCNE